MLSNPNFLSKAAPEKIEAERAKLEKYQSTYDEVVKHLEELKK
jgi:valyl-tRNA synthetase